MDTLQWNINYPLIDGNLGDLRDLQIIFADYPNGGTYPCRCFLEVVSANRLAVILDDPLFVLPMEAVVAPGTTITETTGPYSSFWRILHTYDAVFPPHTGLRYEIEPCCILWLMTKKLDQAATAAKIDIASRFRDGFSVSTTESNVIVGLSDEVIEASEEVDSPGLHLLNGSDYAHTSIRGTETVRVSVFKAPYDNIDTPAVTEQTIVSIRPQRAAETLIGE